MFRFGLGQVLLANGLGLCFLAATPWHSESAVAGIYYVAEPKGPDGVAAVDASDSYPGTKDKPFATIGRACDAARAGDTVIIRGGVYREILRPQNSGTADRPITFQAAPGEKVTICESPKLTKRLLPPDEIEEQEGRSFGIYLYGHAYITLTGLTVTDVTGWARVVKSHDIVIRDGHFEKALGHGRSGGINFVHSDHNTFSNNTLDDGNDNLLLIHSDRNFVSGNRITRGRHVLWCIRAGNFNIICDNYFHNEWQKIGEVYDAEKDPPIIFDAAKHNLIERNTFAYAPSSGNKAPYAGIQYAGQEGIIRQNIFYDIVGPGLDMTLYKQEARYNTHNRVYNNIFHHIGFGGINLSGQTEFAFDDNVFKNNILTGSVFAASDTRWKWYTQVLAGQPVQLFLGRMTGFQFENNNLFGRGGDEPYLITWGSRNAAANPPGRTVAWWEANHDTVFRGNTTVDPRYVNEEAHDFHLKPDSPLIGAGAFLTTTTTSGNGTVLPVEDVRYFCDGFGARDEARRPVSGDLIQLEGHEQAAQILAINYTANTLQLNQVLSWSAGQGVALHYPGKKPDLGAYAYVSSPPPQEPAAPSTTPTTIPKP